MIWFKSTFGKSRAKCVTKFYFWEAKSKNKYFNLTIKLKYCNFRFAGIEPATF